MRAPLAGTMTLGGLYELHVTNFEPEPAPPWAKWITVNKQGFLAWSDDDVAADEYKVQAV
jgi:hypothetical protein